MNLIYKLADKVTPVKGFAKASKLKKGLPFTKTVVLATFFSCL